LDLASAATADTTKGTSGFVTAERELDELTLLPDSNETTAQIEEAGTLVRRINKFFGTSGEYGGGAAPPTTTTTARTNG
jgi:hypothetical protein